VALFCAAIGLNQSAPPKGLVPFSNWNRAEDPLSDGAATCCAMEKTAIAVPVHEPKHDRQPPMLCISGIVFALGLVEGEGAAVAPCIEVPWPPHPATAAQAANVKITRLERNTFSNFAIVGNFLRRQSFHG
jgi:hypothetical protein